MLPKTLAKLLESPDFSTLEVEYPEEFLKQIKAVIRDCRSQLTQSSHLTDEDRVLIFSKMRLALALLTSPFIPTYSLEDTSSDTGKLYRNLSKRNPNRTVRIWSGVPGIFKSQQPKLCNKTLLDYTKLKLLKTRKVLKNDKTLLLI